jgi:hypothetical protein
MPREGGFAAFGRDHAGSGRDGNGDRHITHTGRRFPVVAIAGTAFAPGVTALSALAPRSIIRAVGKAVATGRED